MSCVFCATVLLIDLISLLPKLILYAMFNHQFSSFFFFILLLLMMYLCCIYLFFVFFYLTVNKVNYYAKAAHTHTYKTEPQYLQC